MTHVERTADGLRIHGAHPYGDTFANVLVGETTGGRRVLAVVGRTMGLFDARTGELISGLVHSWPMSPNDVTLTALPDGRVILVAAHDFGISLFDALARSEYEPTGDEEPTTIWSVTQMRLPDGRTIIAGAGHDGLVYRWDAATGAAVGQPLQGHTIIVKSVTAARGPSGSPIIVSGCERGEVRRWDATTGAPIGGPLPGDLEDVSGLGVVDLPDGRQMLACADFEGGMHRWDPATGLPLGSRVATPERAHLVAAHLNDRGVPMCWLYVDDNDSGDEWIERWRLDTGTPVARESPVSFRAVFDDGGRTKVVRSHPDGSLTIEPLPPVPE